MDQQSNEGEQSAVQKAQGHLMAHRGKYSVASALATLVALLQLFGSLGPILCHMPWVKDPAACDAQASRAKAAANELGTLKLDDGSPMFIPADGAAGGAP